MGPHGPVSQAPAPQPAKVGVAGPTAKVESCFSTAELRHEGQSTASPNRGTSFSKLAWQSEQTYS
jgi:hypothetical protein